MESWDSAENKCENLTSRLVSILDSFEHSFITYYIQQNTFIDQTWIGFSAKTYNTTQVSFKWIDENPNFVSYWANKQPSINETLERTCVYQTRNSGNWSNDSCNEKNILCVKYRQMNFQIIIQMATKLDIVLTLKQMMKSIHGLTSTRNQNIAIGLVSIVLGEDIIGLKHHLNVGKWEEI
jgi:hypothetical protein